MSNPHNITVGQELFEVIQLNRRTPYTTIVTVVKVGRKFATLSDGDRVYLEDLYIDGKGYTSPGRVYLSAQDYHDDQFRRRLWGAIEEHVIRTPFSSALSL